MESNSLAVVCYQHALTLYMETAPGDSQPLQAPDWYNELDYIRTARMYLRRAIRSRSPRLNTSARLCADVAFACLEDAADTLARDGEAARGAVDRYLASAGRELNTSLRSLSSRAPATSTPSPGHAGSERGTNPGETDARRPT